MSKVTLEMVEAFQAYFADKGLEVPSMESAVGSLRMWENGQGELLAELVNGSELFFPLVESYYAALDQEVPESVKVPLNILEEPQMGEGVASSSTE